MAKIRIASKNFLCEKCNKLISSGESYFDWWNTNKDGTYYHRRFHIGCINNTTVSTSTDFSNIKSNKLTIFEHVQNLLEKENGCLLAVNYPKNEKCYVCGIHYDEDGNKSFLCETWEDRKPYYVDLETFKKSYVDENGKYF